MNCEECMICLQGLKYHNGKDMLISPCCCGKFFHVDCIYEMSSKLSNDLLKCPQCRKTMDVPNIIIPSSKLIRFKLWHSLKSKSANYKGSSSSSLSVDDVIRNEQCRKCNQQLNIRGGDKPILSPGCCGTFYHVACFNDVMQTTNKAECQRCKSAFNVSKIKSAKFQSLPRVTGESQGETRSPSVANPRIGGIFANWEQSKSLVELLYMLLLIGIILGAIVLVTIAGSFITIFLCLWYGSAYRVAAFVVVGFLSIIIILASRKEIRSYVASRLLIK